MAEGAVGAVTDAPKKALSFARNQLLAFVFLAILLMIVFVAVETRKPGAIRGKVFKIPGLGPWALNQQQQRAG